MDEISIFVFGFLVGVFRKEVYEQIGKFAHWLTTPNKKAVEPIKTEAEAKK